MKSNRHESATPKLLRAPQVARTLGISERTLRRLVGAGHAPEPIRLGRRVLWSVEELDAWLQAGCPHLTRAETSR
jgi:excisionase family DNA binding protein